MTVGFVRSNRFAMHDLSGISRLALTLGVVALATIACQLMYPHFDLSNLIMLYLLAVVWVALNFHLREAVIASVISVASFDFFFVHPRLTFAVSNLQYILTFLVMLFVSLVISSLLLRLRQQTARVTQEERRAAEARLNVETEKLRNTLLSSISHDLRTPLASISGAASALVGEEELPEMNRRDLARTIWEESERLATMLRNVLDLTRLEMPGLALKREWQSLEELVGSAISRTTRFVGEREVHVALPADLPLIEVDGVLVEQLLVNLLENVARHTPPDSKVSITAQCAGNALELRFADNGPGVSPGAEQLVFEKFQGRGGRGRQGFGLGLTICHAIMQVHGGAIHARNLQPAGFELLVTFPQQRDMPQVVYDE